MAALHVTSTGHTQSDAGWLDTHFQSARQEYEDSLRFVGMKPSWRILDAGCGGGGFLYLMSQLVGPTGTIAAIDLAPENIQSIKSLIDDGRLSNNVQPRTGSILSLPYGNATFDCVWSANVMQYLSEDEFDKTISEFKRVLKPGGLLAIKDFDDTILQLLPINSDVIARFVLARRKRSAQTDVLGPSGIQLPARLRRCGLTDIRRRGWLVERWGPAEASTRAFAEALIRHWASAAVQYRMSDGDIACLSEAATNPNTVLDDPEFCLREGFVVAVARVPL